MKNLGQLMKQAQQMQSKMAEMQAQLETVEMTGTAGGGMVQVTRQRQGRRQKLKIDKSVVDPDDVEVLEDLIVAAFNDAKQKVNTYAEAEMQKLTGGLGAARRHETAVLTDVGERSDFLPLRPRGRRGPG